MKSRVTENTAYWLKHVEACKISGLNKHKYCDQHGVSYHRFLYWFDKLNKKPNHLAANSKTNQFIKVKLNSETEHMTYSAKPLCILELKQGHRLIVHNESVLVKILSMLSE